MSLLTRLEFNVLREWNQFTYLWLLPSLPCLSVPLLVSKLVMVVFETLEIS